VIVREVSFRCPGGVFKVSIIRKVGSWALRLSVSLTSVRHLSVTHCPTPSFNTCLTPLSPRLLFSFSVKAVFLVFLLFRSVLGNPGQEQP